MKQDILSYECKKKIEQKISVLKQDLQDQIMDDIKILIELERKAVKKLQLVEIQALHLRKDDVIFNLSNKTLHKVHYCQYRKDCQFNIEKGNKEILVDYGDDEACDYFNELSTLYILVDISEIVNIHNRPEPKWEETK